MRVPNEPSAGTPIDASWGQDVVQCLRDLTPRGGPGVLVSAGHGVSISAQERLAGGVPRNPRTIAPKMFRASCWRNTIYIRQGVVQWGPIPITPGVHPDDTDDITLADGVFSIDTGIGWTDDDIRYAYGEIVFGNPSVAYVRITADNTIPADDPLALTVRWPLAEVTGYQLAIPPNLDGGEPVLVFWTSVKNVCHDGIIKMPGEFGPPGRGRRSGGWSPGVFGPANAGAGKGSGGKA